MSRQTMWLMALLLTCAPAFAASPGEDRVARDQTERAQGARKDDKDKPQPASASRTPDDRWKWWLYDRAELRITDEQSSAINDIFESTIHELRAARQELVRAEDELSKTIKEHKVDIAVVSLQLDRVESARSQHNKIRTLMLYRIHALLTPEQRVKLEALRARRSAEGADKPPSAKR